MRISLIFLLVFAPACAGCQHDSAPPPEPEVAEQTCTLDFGGPVPQSLVEQLWTDEESNILRKCYLYALYVEGFDLGPPSDKASALAEELGDLMVDKAPLYVHEEGGEAVEYEHILNLQGGVNLVTLRIPSISAVARALPLVIDEEVRIPSVVIAVQRVDPDTKMALQMYDIGADGTLNRLGGGGKQRFCSFSWEGEATAELPDCQELYLTNLREAIEFARTLPDQQVP